MIEFSDITEANFESILRRVALIKIQARFVDRAMLEAMPEDAAKYGIFPRDPDAKDFLTSGPAVAAGHRMQISFEMDHNEAACRDIVANYTRAGGDKGETVKYMRRALRHENAPKLKEPTDPE